MKEKFMLKDMKFFVGVEEVLKFVDKNVIMIYKYRVGVMDILKYYGWEKYFVDMVIIDDGFFWKFNFLVYNYLYKKYNIDLVIGDRELDLLFVKELGILICMF